MAGADLREAHALGDGCHRLLVGGIFVAVHEYYGSAAVARVERGLQLRGGLRRI